MGYDNFTSFAFILSANLKLSQKITFQLDKLQDEILPGMLLRLGKHKGKYFIISIAHKGFLSQNLGFLNIGQGFHAKQKHLEIGFFGMFDQLF